uniref:Uncharacterized protein n=1 Tax=Arundo donax TaxID=35708 RepID=A0A0A8ZNR8_ARUDO
MIIITRGIYKFECNTREYILGLLLLNSFLCFLRGKYHKRKENEGYA